MNTAVVRPSGAAVTGPSPTLTRKKVPDVVRVACHFVALRNRPAAVFLLAEGTVEGKGEVPITRKTVDQLANALADDRFDELDVLIQSSGGDIHAAYQMMLLLRRHMNFDDRGLIACVPRKAQSSATLLCLGADEIVLSEVGSLGPLDAQIKKGITPLGTPDYSSALHLLKGLNRLQKFSLETFDETAARLYDHNVRSNEDLVKYSIEFSKAVTAPLFERIQSQDVGYWDQMLQTGAAYGRRLLTSRHLLTIKPDADPAERIDEVVQKLVYEYPSHETVLDRDELAEKLGFKANLLDEPLLPAARAFSSCTSETFIALVYPPNRVTPITDAEEVKLADWKLFKDERRTRSVQWTNGDGTFAMRVGLYREQIPARNPWREDGTSEGGAPREQFLAAGAATYEEPAAPPSDADYDIEVGTAVPKHVAYPRLDIDGHHDRPDTVVVGEDFDVTVGIAQFLDDTMVSTSVEVGALPAVLDAVLLYDPDSLEPKGETRVRLRVSADHPYPAVTTQFTAKHRAGQGRDRRIGVNYFRDGKLVGVAWKSIIAVNRAIEVPDAPRPATREGSLLNLAPLLEEGAPDLLLAVFSPDSGADDQFVWSAYTNDPDITVPDGSCVGLKLEDVKQFATDACRTVQFGSDEYGTYRQLVGYCELIGNTIPAGIRDTIRQIAEKAGRTSAAAVLLLTEEVYVPWELASFADQPIQTQFGHDSPFLGAHVAIARWPLSQGARTPDLVTRVAVGHSAVLTADYEGVPGWSRLSHAKAEASAILEAYQPVDEIKPNFTDVIDLFDGTPPVDVVHVALHGQFSTNGTDEGLVLVGDQDGKKVAQFLTPIQVRMSSLPQHPFIFLNACQVGSAKKVLGDYGGFASALLRKGVGGVVAPLWNINDDVAKKVALGLYETEFTREPGLPVAEYLRRARAEYTESATRAHRSGVTSTLIAYQLFGHPRLALDWTPQGKAAADE